MKRKFWAPALAIGAAILILVPTTLAVGGDGEVQYARLGQNNFPGRIALVDAQLRFISERNIRLDIQIQGGAGRQFAPRIYVDGTCANPGGTGGLWMINRTEDAGPFGPFLLLSGNANYQLQVNQLDVTRVRRELSLRPNQNFALMIATVINGANYRTCTQFSLTPPGPITFTSSTTTGTTTSSSTTRRTTTSLSTGTTFSTGTSFQTTVSQSISAGSVTSASTSFGITPVSTATSLITSSQTLVTFPLTTSTVGTATTITSLSTVLSTFTTVVTTITTGVTFTTGVTLTTGTVTFTTGTTFTTASTITL